MKKEIVAFCAIAALGLASCSATSTGGDYAPPAEVPNAQGAPPQDLGSALPQQQSESGENPPADVAPPESAPVDAPPVPPPDVASSVAEPPHRSLPQAVFTPSPSCTTQRVPGSYISIVAPGRITGTTFTATVGALWQRSRYVASSSTPKPKSKSPSPQRGYVYSGTYTVKRSGIIDTVGCVTLTTSTNGTNFNAQPRFERRVRGTMIGSGSVSKLAITRLSATGGSGSFVLSNGLTGTIKLTARQRTP